MLVEMLKALLSGRTGFSEYIGCNTFGDALCRLMDRVLRQMGVARRRLDVVVAQQLADSGVVEKASRL